MSEPVPPQEPHTAYSPEPAAPPRALKWVTTPLLIMVILNALLMLVTPFSSEAAYPLVQQTLDDLGMSEALTPEFIQTFMWTMFFMFAAAMGLIYAVLQGVKAGKRWAWIASMLVAALSLIAFPPISTILAFILFFGIFHPSVRAYFASSQPPVV